MASTTLLPVWLAGRDLPFASLSPDEFETFCHELLRLENPGADVVRYGKSQDAGRDIVLREPGRAPVIYQCKHYARPVGVREVRQELAKLFANVFASRLAEAPDALVFLLSTRLTSPAQDLLDRHDVWRSAAPAALREHLGRKPPGKLLAFANDWWPRIRCESGTDLTARAKRYPDLVNRFFTVQMVVTGDIASLQALLLNAAAGTAPTDDTPFAPEPEAWDAVQQRARLSPLAAREGSAPRELGDATELRAAYATTIVAASAGMGKSLLLRRIAAQAGIEAALVPLAQFDGHDPQGRPQSFAAYVRAHANRAAARPDTRDVLLLFDGFDQIQQELREEVANTIVTFRRWMLTTRTPEDLPYAVRAAAGGVAELLPLSDPELRLLLGRQLDPVQVEGLLDALKERNLLELCCIPLHAHMAAALSVLNDALPATEFELLTQICRELLDHVSRPDSTPAPSAATVDATLLALAFGLSKRGRASVDRQEGEALVGAASTLALEQAARAGVIHAGRRVAFSHQRFQECYAARNVLASLKVRASPLELMEGLPWWTTGWWDEPIRLAADVAGAEAVATWLAELCPLAAWKVFGSRSYPRPSGLTDRIRAAARRLVQDSDILGAHHGYRFLDWLDLGWRPGIGVDPAGIPSIVWVGWPGADVRVAQYPVTRAQYAAFLRDVGDVHGEPAEGAHGSDPMVAVSWDDARAFCDWLSAKVRRQVRLPNVVEWEAAAGPAGAEYPWGEWQPGLCNVRASGIGSTSPVGAVPAGASLSSGAMDMSGNVWEWCAEGDADHQPVKGGSWASYAHHATIRFGNTLPRDSRLDEVGFRPLLEP